MWPAAIRPVLAGGAVLLAASGVPATPPNIEVAGGGRQPSALEVLNRALYGPSTDVALESLLATPAEYEGRAVKTRGRFGRAPERGGAYGLSAGAKMLRLEPEAGLAAKVRVRAGSWEGKQVELTGVLIREVPRRADNGNPEEPRFAIRFWGVNGPPPAAGAAAAGGTPVTLEQLVYGRAPADGKLVRAVGKFRGRNLYGDLPLATRRSDNDWVIKDDFFAVWVTGKGPDGEGFHLDPFSRADTESWVEVVGQAETRSGITYLRAQSVLLAEVTSAVVARTPAAIQSYRVPSVVFTLPVQGDGLTANAPIVIQFNKHMDEVSFAGRVRLRYADAPGGLQGPRLLYEDTNRALVVDPIEPLSTGREVILELLDGIVDADGQALKPQGAPPASGVVESLRYRVEG
jgi:hypothetical protein